MDDDSDIIELAFRVAVLSRTDSESDAAASFVDVAILLGFFYCQKKKLSGSEQSKKADAIAVGLANLMSFPFLLSFCCVKP